MTASAESSAFLVPSASRGERLDRFLASQLPPFSRSKIQSLIEQGRVRVDGVERKASHRLEAGERVTIEIPPPAPAQVAAESTPLEILYEDADVAVINKPAGMTVHPGAGADAGTMVGALLYHFGGHLGLSGVAGPLRPGIVHRLDKDTSGAIVIAKNDLAHRKLVEDFRARRVEKTYLVLVHGRLQGDAGTVKLPIARDLRRRSRMTARRRLGRAAQTDWRVRLRLNGFTLVEANLRTGRTHQIRAHFAALGCPVVGDTLYGAPRRERVAGTLLPPLERNFLHSARLGFVQPRTGKTVAARAPLAPELTRYLETLGRLTEISARSIDAALGEFL
jgi:23S rRNA pseudouridine1911/1915/1917 synthase